MKLKILLKTNSNLPSNCVKQCKLDITKTHCEACKRTIEQIIQAGVKRNEDTYSGHGGDVSQARLKDFER